jgi:hypothetical protein
MDQQVSALGLDRAREVIDDIEIENPFQQQ